MSLKKKTFSEDEILIYDEAVIYKRGDIWQFRYWLVKERRYVRLSLNTKNQVTAIDTAKKHFVKIKSDTDSGKTYYSKTAKDGVLMYLEYRKGHIDSRTTKSIVKGRYGTIRAHLEHWLDFIERDTKLKELDRDSCADYAKNREKPSATKTTALSTIANEQSTINSMMKWLHKKGEVYIDGFDFETISIRNTPEEAVRRSSFTDEEVWAFRLAISYKDVADMCGTSRTQIEKTYYHIDEDILTTQAMAGYYTIDGMIVPK